MNVFLRWARTSRTAAQRIGFLVLGGIVFLGILPLVLLGVSRWDALSGGDAPLQGPVSLALGFLLIPTGGALALWSIAVQVDQGSGTPLPMAPTQRLLTAGPFGWCRNPMALGTILAYTGLSLAIGSLASLLLVALLGGLLLLFIKRVEERELALRFGNDYLAYRASTPFLMPRRPNHRPHTEASRSSTR
jgi:protein-S-isoprenylcysteine O-methyltransferase Ste14